jgi:hypothetical protein
MRAAHFEATQLHGAHQALRKGAVVIDDDEGAILWKLVLSEGKVFWLVVHFSSGQTRIGRSVFRLHERLLPQKESCSKDRLGDDSRPVASFFRVAPAQVRTLSQVCQPEDSLFVNAELALGLFDAKKNHID